MNSALAQYLFAQDTLYKIESRGDIVPVENHTPVLKTENSKTFSQEEKILAEETEPKVFEMKTHHLIVVRGITEENRAFLNKILLALNLSFTKIDLLDMSKYSGAGFKEIIYKNSVNTILFLGENAGGEFLNRLNLTNYQIKEIKQIKFLKTDDLNTVESNQNNEKRLLWESLKQFY